eukprot:NODE_549_length_6847_cov_0.284084.p1 type:complete len:562 gc:universal NODE_549_length_6847_cov_0.284084:5032-3347(-)
MTNLREVVKTRIKKELLQPTENMLRVLVVDPLTVKLLNNCMSMYDILSENITLIESLQKKRQPFQNQDAVYFLSPCPESVRRFIYDWPQGKNKLYSGAYVYFSSPLSDELFEEIKNSNSSKYIKKLVDVYFDFLPIDSFTFTVNMPNIIYHLFSPSGNGNAANYDLAVTAQRFAGVCYSLGEYPTIRYFGDNSTSKTNRFAISLQQELDKLRRTDDDYKNSAVSSTILIYDRSFDPCAPLLHEFTYEAMAHDLLPKRNNKFVCKGSAIDGSTQEKEILPDEFDKLWTVLRHKHIAEVSQTITSEFTKFLSENKAASQAAGKRDANTEVNINDLKRVLQDLPQYQDLKDKYAVHLTLAQDCMEYFNKRRFSEIAPLEQNLATGESSNGDSLKNIIADIVEVLDAPDMRVDDKLIIMMLYIYFKSGIKDDDRRKLLEHANIPYQDAEAITNYAYFGVQLTKNKTAKLTKSVKKVFSKKRKPDDVPFELSRFVPNLKNALEDFCDGTFDKSAWPAVREPKDDRTQLSSNNGQSLRTYALINIGPRLVGVQEGWKTKKRQQRETD